LQSILCAKRQQDEVVIDKVLQLANKKSAAMVAAAPSPDRMAER
jgi:hypothetical protein